MFLCLQASDDSATLVWMPSFPGEESRMTTAGRGARPHSKVEDVSNLWICYSLVV
jgi:hypothetical protein